MRLSELLRKNTIETTIGGIINKFKIKRRWTTLFFEEILGNYVKMCEDAGHSKEMEKIGEKWGSLGTKQLSKLKMFHSIRLLNQIMKSVWRSIGLMEDFKLTKTDDKYVVETKNEFITRIIGKNRFMIGVFSGCSESLSGKCVEHKETKTKGKFTKYIFKIKEKHYSVESKEKNLYNKLNTFPTSIGTTFKKALGLRLFTMDKNNITYFRGKSLIPIENTLFHLISNGNVMLERVAEISYKYFKDVVDLESTPLRKMFLLKTLVHAMGWGLVKMTDKKNKIKVEISNLPIGLQTEKDNFTFLAYVILGYFWIVDRSFEIEKIACKKRNMTINLIKSHKK